jgi:hypothetical protein
MPLPKRWLRIAPFLVLALFSICMAARAPAGRKPFTFDFDVTPAALSEALSNPLHICGSAGLLVAAVLATGLRRIPLAIGLTVLVGLSWEVAQTTVVGHHARLRDLVPDLAGALMAAVSIQLLVLLMPHRADSRRR